MITDIEDAKLSRVIRSWAAEARQSQDAHPDNDALLAYYSGDLRTHEAESLREHLALCPECSQRGLDLELFSQPEVVTDAGLASQEAEQEWATTQQALKQMSHTGEPGKSPRSTPQAWVPAFRLLRQPSFGYAAAALFLLSSLGLSLQLMSVMGALRQPRVDVQLVDLQPVGTGTLRDAGTSQSAPVAVEGKPLVLILHLLDPGLYTGYRVEISDFALLDRGAIWSTDDLELSLDDGFTVLLPPGLLADGRYRVRLHGIDSGRLDFLAEYALRLERP